MNLDSKFRQFLPEARRIVVKVGTRVLSDKAGRPLHLLLVDDVFTTGATLLACERALRRALTETLSPEVASRIRISVATLAYVGR